jgi:outer membrane receptor protein involved in Fe transport
MHFLHADAAYLNQAPDFRNSFISPRTRNQAVDNLESETILSAQAGYVLQSAKVKASFDVYYTEFRDRTEVRSFYFDEYNNFVNFVMNNIDQTHQGMELGIEYNPFPGFSIFGVGSVGYYRYSSRPDFSVYVDNSAEVQYLNETAYIDGFLISGTPQTAFAAGFKYFAPKYWRIGLNVNYLADRYLAFSALTRTIDAVKYADHSTDEFTSLIEQDKLPNTYTVDAFLGKSFRFDYKYYLNISLNITNLLNNKDIITGGYEQARLDLSNYDKFDPKYYYFSGLQYFLNVSLRF